MRGWRRWGTCGAMSGVLALGAAAMAVAAPQGAYRGTTSQKQKVSFRFRAGAIRNMTLVIQDRCPDGHILAVTEHYPAMGVSRGRFGGSFVPIGGHPGERAVVSGLVARKTISGRITDTSFSHREGALCHGRAGFTARHV